MNKERRKERRFDEMKQKLTHFLHRRGRRFCATALCVTMLFTNVATSIGSTGDDNDAAEFKITSESLKDALKASVENGEILENEYEFRGTESEAYNGLFEVDGTLYQLKPEIDDDDSKMSLSVYARVYEELVDENGYNITGSEDIIFLLKNDTNKAQKAVIRVDDMVSKVITVAPKSSIQVDGEGPSGDDESSISSGGGGLTVGNSAVSSDGTGIDEESSAAEETVEEKADETEGNISSDTGIENPETNAPEIEADDSGNSESKEEIGNIENSESGKESEDAEVTTPDDSENADSEKESADSGSKNDSGNSSDSSSESDSGNSSGSGSESDSGNNADSGSNSDSGNSADSGSGSDTGSSSDSGSGSDSGSSSDSGSGNDSGSGSDSDSGNSSDSGSGSDSGSSSDSGSDNDSGSSETASISSHYAVRVMAAAATPSEIIAEKETEVEILNEAEATSSETEEEEEDIFSAASPSEATPSEATVPMDGTYYDAVRLGNNAVVAFVVKAEELGLDDKVFEASLDNVIVRVTADRGVLPNGAELSVTELTETGDTAEQYQEAKAALDEAGTEYSGMMALDICFLDKDGNEVEPDTEAGEVRVTIEMASEFLPEDVDHNTLSVQHLKEKEDGSIEVEQVADAADSTDGTVEKKEEIEEGTTVAEFSVESFSTFTVTWNSGGSTYFSMTVHCVSEDDLDTELTNDTTEYTISLNNTGTVTVPLSDYKKDIAGYIYKEAHFASTTGTVITHLDATISGSNRSVKLYNEENSDNAPYNETYNNTKLTAEVWLVYQKEVVSLQDSISENGLLNAVLTNGATGDGYIFEWYKSETGGSNESDWELVEREKVTGDSYNITENGMAVNVAYDDGARHYYKVKVYDETGTLIGTSSEYFISYYDELQNGGFEEPTVTGWRTYRESLYVQLLNGTEDLVWQTTGSDGKIEITGTNPNGAYNFNYYVEGERAAEINCGAYGSLYQDVLTAPGSTLYWRLAHIGRKGKDTMRVVIMSAPEAIAANITSQEDVTALYADHPEYFQIPYNQDTVDIVDDVGTWNYYYGEYTVPEGQYVTRFFFVAVDAAGGKSQGNLVDDIWFSTKLPPPNPDKGNLVVTKIVSGLSEDEVAQYKLKITVNGTGENNNSFVESRILENFTKNEDGTYSASGNLPNMSIGSYKVTETVLKPTSLPYEEPKVTVMQAVVDINGNAGEKTEVQPDTTAGYKIEVAERSTTNVELTNTYTKKPAILELKKLVAGNGGDKTASYKFTLKINDVLVTNENTEVTITQGDDIVIVSAEGKFSLKHGKPVKITGLYVGDSITITEDDYSGEGYTTTVNDSDNPSSSYTIDTLSGTQTVTFTNTKTITPPTGIFTNNLPFLMMMAIAFCGMAVFLVPSYKKRRYRA